MAKDILSFDPSSDRVRDGERSSIESDACLPMERAAADQTSRSELLSLFRERVESGPEDTALITPLGRVKWSELADKTSAYFRLFCCVERVGAPTVAIQLDPCADATAAVFAALKVGGRYVFCPPGLAHASLSHLLDQCSADFMVNGANSVVELPAKAGATKSEPDWSPAADVISIAFTSGSAGASKAFLLSAGSILNRLRWMWNAFPFQPGEICMQYKHPSVVGSIWEMFGGLLGGVTTYIASPDEVRDPVRFFAAVSRNGVTRASLTPPLAEALVAERRRTADPDQLSLVCSSAEQMPPDLPERWRSAFPNAKLLNLYGSTECSSNALAFDTSHWSGGETVPVGRPISNVEVWVLGADGMPVPDGGEGELHIGGACLAAGQIGERDKPGLVRRRLGNRERRLFPTGDRARMGPHGVELLGRLDDQLKIHGLRVHLSEVEAALRRAPQVSRAVVLPLRKSGSTVLVAAICSDTPVCVDRLRSHFFNQLPATHFPARIRQLAEIPLTTSGKVDRAALLACFGQPNPASSSVDGKCDFPAFAAVLSETLMLSDLNEGQPLLDQGCDSLLLLDAILRINTEYAVALTIAEIFEAATPNGIFAMICQKQAEAGVQ